MLAPPNLPEPIPQRLSAFSTRWMGRDDGTEIGINITQVLKPGGQGGLLLDIDVYKIGPFTCQDGPEAIRQVFTSLHDMKNRVFFSLVTERCLQLFQ